MLPLLWLLLFFFAASADDADILAFAALRAAVLVAIAVAAAVIAAAVGIEEAAAEFDCFYSFCCDYCGFC